ncbi:MAG: right-handed parallel beta-helix repeat-containing protein [Methylocella sp.]
MSKRFHPRVFFLVGVLATNYFLLPSATFAATYYIDPSAASNGNGTQARPFNSWSWVAFQPGNTYLQRAGTTYPGLLQLSSVHGTASLPITIDSYGTGAAPIITNVVLFDNSSYITFQNFIVTNVPTYHSVIIRNGSTYITVHNNSITNAAASGIFLGPGGCNNVISNNSIHLVASDGIDVNQAVCTNGHQTLIYGNTIHNIGVHGIELDGNFFIIDHNIIHDTGRTTGGASGIHIYGGGFRGAPPDGLGSDNVVSNNVIYNAHEPLYHDGNGVQCDKYTHNNNIYNNLIFRNDGMGVDLYDSHNNQVYSNTLFTNVVNTLGKYFDPRGNLTNSTSVAHTHTANASINNNFSNNVIISSLPNSDAFDVGSNSIVSGSNNFGGNMALSIGGSHYYHYAGIDGDNQGVWNNTYFPGGGNDTFGTIPVSDIAKATVPMDFIIPSSVALTLALGGKTVTLYGWRADTGLYGRFSN